MTLTLVNDRRARQDTQASRHPAAPAPRDSLGPVLALPGWPSRWVSLTAPEDPGAALRSAPLVGARLRMSALEALALPPSVTARRAARWIVPPEPGAGRPPRLPSVLSAVWQTVAG